MPDANFIPALRFHGLTRIFDPVMRFTMPEDAFRRKLVKQSKIAAGAKVLDLGCGTGTLSVMVKQECPEAHVFGVDIDPRIVVLACRKAENAKVAVEFRIAKAGELPFPPASFDRVLTSLVLHHLTTPQKVDALREAWRILRSGGELHIADWGHPANAIMGAAFLMVRRFDGFANTEDNMKGRIPRLVEKAGFHDVQETSHFPTLFGSLRLWRARRP